VIAFVIITSILNLALGYALAVYLGTASRWSAVESERPGEPRERINMPLGTGGAGTADSLDRLTVAASEAGTRASRPMSLPESSASLAAAAGAEEGEQGEEYRASTPGVEKGLLAGIEEFRNQLAQLKGHAAPTELPEALGPLLGR
jgi:hypothetical protein